MSPESVKMEDFRRILLDIGKHVDSYEGRLPGEIITFSNIVAKKLAGPHCEDLEDAMKKAETEIKNLLAQKSRTRTDAKRYMEDLSMALEVAKEIIYTLGFLDRRQKRKVA